jgi:CheY-like chemotaxis protein
MKGLKVMLVDDSQPCLDIMGRILSSFGARDYVACKSVGEAADRLALEAFDLLIADGEMPEQDGFDLTERVRRDNDGPNFTIPILLASAYTPRSKIERAKNIGANMVVVKPIVPDVLLGRIEWMAKTAQQYVDGPGYRGPCRRENTPASLGADDRRVDADRLMTQPERELSQADVDNLFD